MRGAVLLMTAINPLTTAVLGAFILHEPFGISSVIGALLIITAIVLHNVSSDHP